MNVKRNGIIVMLVALILSLFLCGMTVSAESDMDDISPTLTIADNGNLPEKALLGTKVTAATATATDAIDGELVCNLRVSFNGDTLLDTTQNREYTLDRVGLYSFYYEAKNSRDLYAFKNFEVDVREYWLVVELDGKNVEAAPVGSIIVLKGGSVKGFSGSVLSDVTAVASVNFEGADVALVDNAFTPNVAGAYIVTYTAKKGNEIVTLKNTISVYGQKPSITVKNVPTSGTVGERIELPSATARDAQGTVIKIDISVRLGETAVAVENSAFTPAAAGDYTVIYSAMDEQGISQNQKFTIKVEKKAGCGCGSSLSSDSIGVMLTLAFCVMMAVILLVRTRKQA